MAQAQQFDSMTVLGIVVGFCPIQEIKDGAAQLERQNALIRFMVEPTRQTLSNDLCRGMLLTCRKELARQYPIFHNRELMAITTALTEQAEAQLNGEEASNDIPPCELTERLERLIERFIRSLGQTISVAPLPADEIVVCDDYERTVSAVVAVQHCPLAI